MENNYYLLTTSQNNLNNLKIFTKLESMFDYIMNFHNQICFINNLHYDTNNLQKIFNNNYVCACDEDNIKFEYKDIIDEFLFNNNTDKFICKICDINILECYECEVNLFEIIKNIDNENIINLQIGKNKDIIINIKKINFDFNDDIILDINNLKLF
jgi:hypothetical protein